MAAGNRDLRKLNLCLVEKYRAESGGRGVQHVSGAQLEPDKAMWLQRLLYPRHTNAMWAAKPRSEIEKEGELGGQWAQSLLLSPSILLSS